MRNPSLPGLERELADPSDIVYTPDWCAKDMVSWFQPQGRILDPCRGSGAFFKYLPPSAIWCEITEGRDFYNWDKPVDWIIGNPPYSTLRDWVKHSFLVASDIVYLIPLKNFFSAYGFIEVVRYYGWIKHIRVYGTGSRLGFPMGNAIGAVYFKKGFWGDTSWSFYT